MKQGAALCPVCGFDTRSGDQLWPNISTIDRHAPDPQDQLQTVPAATAAEGDAVVLEPPPDSADALPGFISASLGSWRYALTNYGSVVRLVFYWGLIAIATQFGLKILSPMACFGLLGVIILMVVTVLAMLGLMGYTLRYYLNTVLGSLEGIDEAPDCPPVYPRDLVSAGGWGLAMFVVYVLPVVTLPLLPLGILACAVTTDGRCCDLVWAWRAARRRPVFLLALWPILLIWALAALAALVVGFWILGIVLAAMLKTGPCLMALPALLVFAVGSGLILAVSVAIVCVMFRCIGLLGRTCPDLLDCLPDTSRRGSLIAAIASGVAVGLLAVYLTVGASWPDMSSGGSDVDAAPRPSAPGGHRQIERFVRDPNARKEMQSFSTLRWMYTQAMRYAAGHAGKFPQDISHFTDLVSAEQLSSPGDPTATMQYLPGQSLTSDKSNILAYDPTPYGGKYLVLLVGGAVETIAGQEELLRRLAVQQP